VVKDYNNDLKLSEIIKEGKTVLQFSAPWCSPCKIISPAIEGKSEEMTDTTFIKVNVDHFPEVSAEYDIMNVPVLIEFENGEQKGIYRGQNDILEWIRS
jgi:thioredoxin 1